MDEIGLEQLALVCRMCAFVVVLAFYLSISHSKLLGGKPWWNIWIGFLVASLVRDIVRFIDVGSSSTWIGFWVSEWILSGVIRSLFVIAFVSFGGRRPSREPVVWIAVALTIIDAWSTQHFPVPPPTDIAGRIVMYLTIGVSIWAIVIALKPLPCWRFRWPCFLSGCLFITRFVPWVSLESLGVLAHEAAATGMLIWSGMTIIMVLMCFLNTNLLLVAMERSMALDIAATYIQRDTDDRRITTNGGGTGAAKPFTPGRIRAGQAG